MVLAVFDILNRNSGALRVLFTAVVTVATVATVILNARFVSETREMRFRQIEPHLSVIVQLREQWITMLALLIQNVGAGPARKITFEIKKSF